MSRNKPHKLRFWANSKGEYPSVIIGSSMEFFFRVKMLFHKRPKSLPIFSGYGYLQMCVWPVLFSLIDDYSAKAKPNH